MGPVIHRLVALVIAIGVAVPVHMFSGGSPPPALAASTLSVIETITVGPKPGDVAVDAARNLVYLSRIQQHGTPGDAGVIEVIDGATNQVVSSLVMSGITVPRGLVVDPATHLVYVAHAAPLTPEMANKVTVIATDADGTNARIADTFDVGITPWDLAVNPTTRRLYAVPGNDTHLGRHFRVVDLDTYEQIAHVPTNGNPENPGGKRAEYVAVDESNNRVYIGGSDGQVIFDGATNQLLAILEHPCVHDVAVNPATERYYAALFCFSQFDVWDAATTIAQGYPHGNTLLTFPGPPSAVAVDPSAGLVYVTLHRTAGIVLVLDATTHQVIANLAVGMFPTRAAANPATGLAYVTNFESGTVSVIGPDTNQPPDCSQATVELREGTKDTGNAEQLPVQTRGDEKLVPNHRWVAAEARGVTDPDGDPIALTVRAITQDEPVADSTAPDGRGVGAAVAEVRAERNGTGDGRVYRIAMRADDGNGGRCDFTLTVDVPRGSGPAIDSGQNYDSTQGNGVQAASLDAGSGGATKAKAHQNGKDGGQHKAKKRDKRDGKDKKTAKGKQKAKKDGRMAQRSKGRGR